LIEAFANSDWPPLTGAIAIEASASPGASAHKRYLGIEDVDPEDLSGAVTILA
jgi:hypothetical protein